jgi:hypothetical protein
VVPLDLDEQEQQSPGWIALLIGRLTLGLVKPPNILTFLVALVLGIAGTLAHLGVELPVIGTHGFWLVFSAFGLLVGGCLFRGM